MRTQGFFFLRKEIKTNVNSLSKSRRRLDWYKFGAFVERERLRERERKRERQRQREKERETDREIERERQRETER